MESHDDTNEWASRIAIVSNSNQSIREDARTDSRNEEIVIGGFGLKSKDGAIKIVEKVIAGNDSNPAKLWKIE